MAEWIYFIHPPRENFAATMTDEEEAVWDEHFQRLKGLLAEGVVELARQMGGDELALEAAGGLEDGTIGTDVERVRAAIERAMSSDGVLVLMDLGSALMSAEMAVELLEAEGRVELSEAPFVEGAVAAAVTAAAGGSLKAVLEAAQEARHARKL